ncbi:MAG: SelB C-terminal domain-containing protein, partial [Armatimonadota bacterium]|nr:SelB C-terminal domain-containing protein [Armatimonadota bacterium]
ATSVLEVWLQVLADAPRGVKDGASLRLHLGTAEVEARVSLYEGARLNLGDAGYARLRLDAPLVCARGDRFVLREVATERIIGGGIILEPETRLSRAAARVELAALHAALEADDEATVAEILLRRQAAAGLPEARLRFELRRLEVSDVLAALRARHALWSGGGIFLHSAVATELKARILAQLREFHQREPLQATMPREALRATLPPSLAPTTFDALLDEMAQAQQIAVSPAGVRLSEHRVTLSEDEARLKERIEALVYRAAWQPPTLDELVAQLDNRDLGRKLCFALIKDGSLVRVGDFVVSARRIAEGAEILRAHIQQQGSLAIGDARDLLNSTRKWLVPLLEHYDRIGLTKRVGEVRVLR